ncbi:MAG: carboxypeptidase regulatory-like domain-containing protein [Chitinophagaceae bacterium]|nr:carboxypeptidase regulatory-like domain-containing protein [Chitinophagaceae bacterium]
MPNRQETDSDADINRGITGIYDLDAAHASATGINETKVDAGVVSTRAALGDKVWLDNNGDGVQDAGEAGISGVTVILYAADGTTVLASTITDANGNYLFPNLTPGNYVVGFSTLPNGLEITQQNTPGDNQNNTNNDASPITGKTGVINLSAGEVDLTVDAGVRPKQLASVGDYVWNDLDGDGVQDANEPGVPGVVATLVDAIGNVIGTAVTDGNGKYLISNIPPGTYSVIFTNLPGGAQFTTQNADVTPGDATLGSDANPSTGRTPTFTLTAGQYLPHVDAGIVVAPLASLGDRVWLDMGAGGGTANNGVQDGTEPGVAGVPVSLYQNGPDGLPGTADDVLVGSTITDAYGNYYFNNLLPSTNASTQYNVRVTPPANYVFTTQTNTTDDNNTTGASTTGSDVNALGVSYSINLSPGENNPNIDAGLIFPSPAIPNSIGDKVWFDTDADGVQDAGEPGVSGVTVTLYDAAGNIAAITTTDASGNYIFNNLPPNTNYTVGFSAPGGTVLTTSTGTTPGNATTNSDADPVTGRTATVNTGAAGTAITGIDAGIKNDPKGALGDYVWNDLNHDGIQDPGEAGVAGVTMTLYGPGPDGLIGGGDDILIATTTTDATGYYIFPNLDPANYFVVATPPAGYTRSPQYTATGNPGGITTDSDFGNGAGPYAGSYVSGLKSLPTTTGGITRDMTVDLGIYNTTPNLNTLGDKVWNDVDKDGLQDAGEAGVPNVTVRLLNNVGNPVNNPATGQPYVVMTDANGNYKFVDLPDGEYMVEFSNIPPGYSFTDQDASGSGAPGSGTDGTDDSDAGTISGRTGIINIDAAGTNPATINITNVDAGISQGIPVGKASLGNRVWYDMDNNGLQDAGELGVSNVKVELLDGSGNPVNVPGTGTPYVVYTNALGEYIFTGLDAGDYQVRFSEFPSGYTSSTANVGANDAIDADANFSGNSNPATTATTGIYSLSEGEDNMTVDMGIVPPAGTNSLGNYVWNDLDSDGKQDAGEPGVQGVTVTLYGNGLDGLPGTADDIVLGTTTTDSLGRYQFVGLPDGNYNVGFSNLPAGFTFTTKDASGATAADGSDANKVSGRTGTVALDPTNSSATGINDPNVDAGIVTTRASLGNYVWLDTNGDGVQDATEAGVPGVTVILYAADGTTVLGSTITDANGKYLFPNLTPSNYVVGFSTIPGGLVFTQQNTPGDNQDNTNSDANPATGKTGVIVLSAGENDMTIDAGLKPNNPASVGDKVGNDIDGDGVQDVNEPGVPGIIVTLYDAANNVVGTAITDGDGNYLISNVPPGNGYYIIFSNLPVTAQFTTQTSDVSTTDATLGSDANTTTGQTASFNLSAGQYLPHVDAGIKNIQLLPIQLISFIAQPQGNNVQLNWVVGVETNIATYQVEYSTTGANYSAIGNTTAIGNRNYAMLHTSPKQGLNYYRLKITDKNGNVTYSEVRKVNFGKGGTISIYPNPTSDVVNITLTVAMVNKAATITVVSIDGRVVANKQITAASQTEVMDVSKLASGKYIVRIITEAEVINKQVEVIR